jgi:hypothetical protein
VKPKALNQKLRGIAKKLPPDFYEAANYKLIEGKKTYVGKTKYPVSHYGRLKQAFHQGGVDGVSKYCKKYNFSLTIETTNGENISGQKVSN